jgi:hypothetical protein
MKRLFGLTSAMNDILVSNYFSATASPPWRITSLSQLVSSLVIFSIAG